MQLLIVSLLLAVIYTSYSMTYSDAERVIWRCGAWNHNRSYLVVQLDRSVSSFDLIIYSSSVFDQAKYAETVQIRINNAGQELTGSGKTLNGKSIKVKAFGGTVAFDVDDEEFGLASGRCNRLVELN